MGGTSAFVEIVAVPDGEAPLWVREKWVGLRLPLAPRRGPLVIAPGVGVLSGPRSLLARLFAIVRGTAQWQTGYAILGTDALRTLEPVSPEAAAWWREHVPHLLQSGRCLLFQASCGRLCEDAP